MKICVLLIATIAIWVIALVSIPRVKIYHCDMAWLPDVPAQVKQYCKEMK